MCSLDAVVAPTKMSRQQEPTDGADGRRSRADGLLWYDEAEKTRHVASISSEARGEVGFLGVQMVRKRN